MRQLVFVCLLAGSLSANAQDSSQLSINTGFLINWDSLNSTISYTSLGYTGGYLYLDEKPFIHTPEEADQKLFDSARHLINSVPTSSNYEIYYALACSLWELNKLQEAKKMFLKIIASKGPWYENAWYHSSDVPGDTLKNIYGYGSYTSHYKSSASTYLTRIYIEQKKFDLALVRLEDAVKKYPTNYSCGTGHFMQEQQHRYLYGLCYEGLGKEKELFQLLLPAVFSDRNNGTIIRAIKKKYSNAQIKYYLNKSLQSITCEVDSLPSISYLISNVGQPDEVTDTIQYYSGKGTIKLFGKTISMPLPNLKNGERLTREQLVNAFRDSGFYQNLLEHAERPVVRKKVNT